MKTINQEIISDPAWITVEEAARRVSTSKPTFYQNLINTGLVRSCVIKKPGNVKGLRRVSAASLAAYLDKISGEPVAA